MTTKKNAALREFVRATLAAKAWRSGDEGNYRQLLHREELAFKDLRRCGLGEGDHPIDVDGVDWIVPAKIFVNDGLWWPTPRKASEPKPDKWYMATA